MKLPKKKRVLYAFQGTGNGHAARALEIVPILKEYAEVDVLVSGSQSEVRLKDSVKYQYRGLVFYYSKKGGVNYLKTLFSNNLLRLIKEIFQVPIWQYDLVINDFEAVTAWSSKMRKIPIISLSHQAAFLSPNSPRPSKKSFWGELILRHYAPTKNHLAFHFSSYDQFIFSPVIRADIRAAKVSNLGHYTVYLPAYADDKLVRLLQKITGVHWHLFSRKAKENRAEGNVIIKAICAQEFAKSMASSAGLLCSAGFEGPSEALFLGKKLFVIPIKGQYEQYCNASALAALGVPTLYQLNEKSLVTVRDWVKGEQDIKVSFPDQTREMLAREIFAPEKFKALTE